MPVFMDHIYELGNNQNRPMDLKINPGTETDAIQFYVKVSMFQAERMQELANRRGTVRLELHLFFSALYMRPLNLKTYGEPIFTFDVNKKCKIG